MIIRKITMENYRSCLKTTFIWDPHLSVLIGPNGSGKTSVLSAIVLLKKLTEEEEGYFGEEPPPTAECTLKVWFEVDNKTVILTANINIYTNENNSDVILSSKQQWYLKDLTGSAKRIGIPLWLVQHLAQGGPYQRNINDRWRHRVFLRRKAMLRRQHIGVDLPEEAFTVLCSIAEHLSGIRYYSASQFTNPSNCPVSFEIEREGLKSRGFRLHGHAKFLFDLYNAFTIGSDGYRQFFDIIGPAGIGLVDEIGFQNILTSSIDYSVRSGGKVREIKREKSLIIPRFTIGKHELSPNQLSEGTFKTITLLFYLVTDSSTILLVEEPEVCVHHGLLSSILELIKVYSKEKQIVVSTHSDFVLDQVAPSNVLTVRRDSELGTEVKHITNSMSKEELSALRDYLDAEGNLGEYWRHGGLETM